MKKLLNLTFIFWITICVNAEAGNIKKEGNTTNSPKSKSETENTKTTKKSIKAEIPFLSVAFNCKLYSTTDGLVNDTVCAIAIDAQNNKWFGTMNGVSKFDGKTWTNYTLANGLPFYDINTIEIDPLGILWFGTLGGGVLKFDGTQWTSYNTSNSNICDDYIWSIGIDSQYKWFGSWGLGVSQFDGSDWVTYDKANNEIADDTVWGITPDKHDNIWLAGPMGVTKFNNGTSIVYTKDNSIIDKKAARVVIDDQDNKWILTFGGIFKFDDVTWTSYNTSNGLANDTVTCMEIERNGNKWFGTNAGLSRFDGTKWTTFLNNRELGYCMAIDKNNYKWVSNGKKGVYTFQDSASLQFDAVGSNSNSFRITSNCNWNITSDADWLSFDVNSGSNNAIINVNASANPTIVERTAKITISGDGITNYTFEAKQDPGSPVLSLSETTINAEALSIKANFDITSNLNWTITCDATWVSINHTSGSDNGSIELTVDANTALTERMATITVSATGVPARTMILKQAGSIPAGISNDREPAIKLSPNPVIDKLLIEIPDFTIPLNIKVISVNGGELYDSMITEPSTIIDMSNYKAGAYIIKIYGSKEIMTRKIVKDK